MMFKKCIRFSIQTIYFGNSIQTVTHADPTRFDSFRNDAFLLYTKSRYVIFDFMNAVLYMT